MKLEYWVEDRGMSEDDAYEFECIGIAAINDKWDERYAAQKCASDFHDSHDGWESSWPLTFHVSADNRYLGKFEVDRESRPHFVAGKVK